MTRSVIFFPALALVLCFGKPTLAQHGPGIGGAVRGGGGGMPNISRGEGRGQSGSKAGVPAGQDSKGQVFKDDSGSGGKKTTSELLTQNSKLSSNLQGLLPTGTKVEDAAKGFDHLGEFVAAVHVSHNLGIPFDQLKTEMTNGNSLGEAIHKLKPNVDARQEAIKANQQALNDMEKSSMAPNKAATAAGR
jgi:hypothetical protein